MLGMAASCKLHARLRTVHWLGTAAPGARAAGEQLVAAGRWTALRLAENVAATCASPVPNRIAATARRHDSQGGTLR